MLHKADILKLRSQVFLRCSIRETDSLPHPIVFMSAQRLPDTVRHFLAGRWVSAAGDWLGASALGWLVVEELHGGSSIYGLVRLVPAVAFILCSPTVGPLINRAKPVKVLLLGCFLSILVDLLFLSIASSEDAFLNHVGFFLTMSLIVLGSFVSGMGQTFRDGAEQRFQALLVPAHDQSRLENAWLLLYYVARVIFGTLSGIVLSAFGTATLFLADACTFLALAAAGVRTGKLSLIQDAFSQKEKTSLWSDIRYGVQTYRRAIELVLTQPVFLLLLWFIYCLEGIAFVAWNFMPELIGEELNEGGFAYGCTIALAGVGGIVGISLRRHLFPTSLRWKSRTFLLALFFPGLGLLLSSFGNSFLFVGLGYAFAIAGWSWVLAPIRILFRSEKEHGPYYSAMLSLVLFGTSRLSQVCLTSSFTLLFHLRPSQGLRVAAILSLVTVALSILVFRRTLARCLVTMFDQRLPSDDGVESGPAET